MVRRLSLGLAALMVALTAHSPAHAIGYWNIPGNFCQCAGYGWGAGYHACYVLGPPTCRGCCAHHEVRLPCAPQPPYASYGCGQVNYDFRRPADVASPTYGTGVEPYTPAIQGELPEDEPTLREVPADQLPSPGPESLQLPENAPTLVPTSSRPLFGAPVER